MTEREAERWLVGLGLFLAVCIVLGGVYVNVTQEQRDIARANRDYAAAARLQARQELITGMIDEFMDGAAQSSDILIATIAGVLGVCGSPVILVVIAWSWWQKRKDGKFKAYVEQ